MAGLPRWVAGRPACLARGMTAGALVAPLLGRIVRPADYVRVLGTPIRLRSAHFAIHHLAAAPLPPARPARAKAGPAPVTASLSTELSTEVRSSDEGRVDDLPPGSAGADDGATIPATGTQRWLGLVVPKKNAKRAVTRTLVKRQIRTLGAQCAGRLEPGQWVVRLRAPFDPARYPSAASEALKRAAREELQALFERAARGERDAFRPREPRGARVPGAPGAAPKGSPPCAA